MGTTQNLSPHQNRAQPTNTNPNPSPNPVSSQAPKVPSFEEVSALFSLTLSDAAESLGVSPSILKNLCYENGLVRWPHRKIAAGKTIDDIKKEAALEKQANSSLIQPQRANTGVRVGVKQLSREGSQGIQGTTMNRGNLANVDEFKYGFPSEGLSTISYRWWGNKEDDYHGLHGINEHTMSPKVNPANSTCIDGEVAENKKNEEEAQVKYANVLRLSREKAARDCGEALELGVHRQYNGKTLGKQKKTVLLQIFQSSLPVEWGDS